MQTWRCSAPIWPVQEIMHTGVCESVSGCWERERTKERTNQRKEEWISTEDEYSVEIGKSALAFDLPKFQISLNQGCQISAMILSEQWDEWRGLLSPQWHNCIWRFLLDSRLHAHSLCQPSASLFRLTDESHLQPEQPSEMCAMCLFQSLLYIWPFGFFEHLNCS